MLESPTVLTLEDSAEFLNMSEPTLIKLLDCGEIPFTWIGSQKKVSFAVIEKYKHRLYQKRLATLAELSELDQELGLGY